VTEPRPNSDRALVIVPTYNERDNIERVIAGVLSNARRTEILIVDDASPDGTGQIADGLAAQNPRIHVLHRAGKEGLGTAYIAGFRWALERDYQYVLEMDADFSHDPGFIPEFLHAIQDSDLVAGSRYLDGRANVINWPMSRLLLSYSANVYARRVTGLPVSDATSGFKCFRRKVLERIDLSTVRSNGYAFQIEMTFRAWKLGFRIREIPIVFSDRMEGHSKMSGKIVREAVWMVWRLRLAGMLGRVR
jgi:dolichol-phosphate mannosyltransferase